MKYWKIIADKLSKAGWSLGCVSAIDANGRTTWIVDAHRDNGKRFVARSEERAAALLELERLANPKQPNKHGHKKCDVNIRPACSHARCRTRWLIFFSLDRRPCARPLLATCRSHTDNLVEGIFASFTGEFHVKGFPHSNLPLYLTE